MHSSLGVRIIEVQLLVGASNMGIKTGLSGPLYQLVGECLHPVTCLAVLVGWISSQQSAQFGGWGKCLGTILMFRLWFAQLGGWEKCSCECAYLGGWKQCHLLEGESCAQFVGWIVWKTSSGLDTCPVCGVRSVQPLGGRHTCPIHGVSSLPPPGGWFTSSIYIGSSMPALDNLTSAPHA